MFRMVLFGLILGSALQQWPASAAAQYGLYGQKGQVVKLSLVLVGVGAAGAVSAMDIVHSERERLQPGRGEPVPTWLAIGEVGAGTLLTAGSIFLLDDLLRDGEGRIAGGVFLVWGAGLVARGLWNATAGSRVRNQQEHGLHVEPLGTHGAAVRWSVAL